MIVHVCLAEEVVQHSKFERRKRVSGEEVDCFFDGIAVMRGPRGWFVALEDLFTHVSPSVSVVLVQVYCNERFASQPARVRGRYRDGDAEATLDWSSDRGVYALCVWGKTIESVHALYFKIRMGAIVPVESWEKPLERTEVVTVKEIKHPQQPPKRKSIAALLKEMDLVTDEEIAEALCLQQEEGIELGRILVDQGVITENDLLFALAAQVDMEVVDLDTMEIPPDVIKLVSYHYCMTYRVMPFEVAPDGTLSLALADPMNNLSALVDLESSLHRKVRGAVSDPASITRAIKKYYREDTEERPVGDMPSPTERPPRPPAAPAPPLPPRPPKEGQKSAPKRTPGRKLLGEILVQAGVVTEDQVELALRLQEMSDAMPHEKIGRILVRKKWITEAQLAQALAKQFGLPFVDLDKIDIPKDVIEVVPRTVAVENNIVPIQKRGKCLLIGITDPLDAFTLGNLRFIFGMEIECVFVAVDAKLHALQKHYGVEKGYDQLIADLTQPYEIGGDTMVEGSAAELKFRPCVNLDDMQIPRDVIAQITTQIARRHRMIPIRVEGYKLTLLSATPLAHRLIRCLEEVFGGRVENLRTTEEAIARALEKYYGPWHDDIAKGQPMPEGS